jgi:predicted hydrolase (HD superfamily)
MTPKDKGESFILHAEMHGYNRKQSVEIAMFAVDKIINHCHLDRIEENHWFDVMDYLESIRLS